MNRAILTYVARSIRADRIRFRSTVICIAVCCTLLTTISATFSSLKQAYQAYVEQSEGAWQVRLDNLSTAGLRALTQDPNVQSMTVVRSYGSAYTSRSAEKDYFGPYLAVESITAAKGDGTTIHPQVTKGRYPRNASEILLPNSLQSAELDALSMSPIQTGSTVTLDLGKRVSTYTSNYGTTLPDDSYTMIARGVQVAEKISNPKSRSFTVVGFYQGSTWSSGAGNIAFTSDERSIDAVSTSVRVRLKHVKDSESLAAWYKSYATIRFDTSDNPVTVGKSKPLYAADDTGVSYQLHRKLLAAEGIVTPSKQWKELRCGVALIGLVIVAISATAIHGCLSMGTSTRNRQLGLLRTVGATKRQARSIVLFEATVALIPGLLLGAVFGLIVTTFLVHGIGQSMLSMMGANGVPLQVSTSAINVLPIAIAIAALVFGAAAISAFHTAKIEPLSALTGQYETDARHKLIKKRSVHRTLTISRGSASQLLAHIQLNRNPRRTVSIVLSLALSLFLVTALTSVLVILDESMDTAERRVTSDIEVTAYTFLRQGESATTQYHRVSDLATHLDRIQGATVTGSYATVMPFASLGKGILSDDAACINGIRGIKPNGSFVGNICTVFLDDQVWNEYLKQTGITADRNEDSSRIEAIALNNMEDPNHPDGEYLHPYRHTGRVRLVTRFKQKQGYVFSGISSKGNATYSALDPDATVEQTLAEPFDRSISTSTDIRIIGITDTIPQGFDITYDMPTIVMPKRSLTKLVNQTSKAIELEPLDTSNPYAAATVPFYFEDGNINGLIATVAIDTERPQATHAAIKKIIRDQCTGPTWGTVSIENYSNEIKEAQGMAHAVKVCLAGLSLAGAFLLFMNIFCTVISLSASRQRELAMLESLGMEHRQLRLMIMHEAMGYLMKAVLLAVSGLGIGLYIGRSLFLPYLKHMSVFKEMAIAAGPLVTIALFVLLYITCCLHGQPSSIIKTLRDDL